MKIIISPAKKMKIDNDDFMHKSMPVYIEETERILAYLRKLDYEELKSLWKASDNISRLNYKRIQEMDLYNNLTPALLSYEGIQYQYMSPGVFAYEELAYINENLRILSGFYGVLRPFDGVVPYRLEMQAKPKKWEFKSLYDFWGSKIAGDIFADSGPVVNLASKEYSQSVSKYIDEGRQIIDITFGEIIDGRVKEKATLVKMARGEMVRYMAEHKIQSLEEIKSFDRLDYVFNQELSSDENLVFIK